MSIECGIPSCIRSCAPGAVSCLSMNRPRISTTRPSTTQRSCCRSYPTQSCQEQVRLLRWESWLHHHGNFAREELLSRRAEREDKVTRLEPERIEEWGVADREVVVNSFE